MRNPQESKKMKRKTLIKNLSVTTIVALTILAISPALSANAVAQVSLGTARDMAVVASSTITNTGPTVITGSAGADIAVSAGTSVTGFPPGTAGTIHLSDILATNAHVDLAAASVVASTGPSITLPSELGGTTLQAGAYSLGSSDLTGTLTLDGNNDVNAVFIIRSASSLTTASNSVVKLINGVQACNVFWTVGSSATLGTNSSFVGHILASSSITATTGANILGSLLAINGSVTLDSNVINNRVCNLLTTASPTPIAVAPGTIHVVKIVNNTNAGKLTPSDFMIHVKHWGVEVAGSPMPGMGGAGRTYVLPPGSYVISEDRVAGYDGSNSGVNVVNAHIMLESGQDVTFIRTNQDWSAAQNYGAVTPVPTSPTTPTVTPSPKPSTVNGGKLPKTGSNSYNMLAISVGFLLVGAFGLRMRKVIN